MYAPAAILETKFWLAAIAYYTLNSISYHSHVCWWGLNLKILAPAVSREGEAPRQTSPDSCILFVWKSLRDSVITFGKNKLWTNNFTWNLSASALLPVWGSGIYFYFFTHFTCTICCFERFSVKVLFRSTSRTGYTFSVIGWKF